MKALMRIDYDTVFLSQVKNNIIQLEYYPARFHYTGFPLYRSRYGISKVHFLSPKLCGWVWKKQ